MNDIFKQNGSNCSPSPSMKEQSSNISSSIKWCFKSLTENGAIKKLSYPKDNDYHNTFIKKSQYEKQQSNCTGYDLRKLYPELSSKLGLTKISSSDKRTKPVKKCSRSLSNNFGSVTENQQHKFDAMCLASEKNSLAFDKMKAKNIESDYVHPIVTNNCEVKKEIVSPVTKHQRDKDSPPPIDTKDHSSQDVTSRSIKSYINSSDECDNRLLSSFTQLYSNKTNIIRVYPYANYKPKVYSIPTIRVQSKLKNAYAYKADLFPLGFESSDCDTSDEEDNSMFPLSTCLCKNQPSISHYHRQQVIASRTRLKVEDLNLKRRWDFMKKQLKAARDISYLGSYPLKIHSKTKFSKNQLINEMCVYKGEHHCQNVSLPGSRHCIKHITYNVDQQLFSQCAAKKENNTLCRTPTFDILHDPPLCQLHTNTTNQATNVVESSIKTKSVKKKTKMMLSRGKRSKKRRHSFESSVVPSTRVRPPINSPGVCFGAASLSSEENFFTTGSSTILSTDDRELGDEFKVIEDVLNKIPDHDLTQILYDTDKLDEEKPNDALSDVTEGCKVIDSIISSSFNQQELNAISQVLSNMANDSNLIMDSFQLDNKDPVLPECPSTSSSASEVSTPMSESVSPVRVTPSPCLLQPPGTNLKVTPL